MDGKTLTQQFLDEADQAGLDPFKINAKSIYTALDKAAVEFVRLTGCLTASVDITSVADQQSYDLPPDFIRPYLKNGCRRLYLKYVSGDNTTWPVISSYEKILKANKTEAAETPARVCLRDKETAPSQITGTTSSAGSLAGGEAVLTDSGGGFSGNVSARDIVHNASKMSSGVVLEVTADTTVRCALFGGKGQSWDNGDGYVIIPAAHKIVYLDAPSENAGDTLTVPYKSMPSPVYSDYSIWRISPISHYGVVCGAVFRFMTAKRGLKAKPEHLREFLKEVRQKKAEVALTILQGGRYSTRL